MAGWHAQGVVVPNGHSQAAVTARNMVRGLPTFTPTSSPALDDILSTLRSKIFLLSHLLVRQQNIIRSPKSKSMLENDVFTAEVGGEKVRLEYVDVTKDVPDAWRSMQKLLDLMKDRKDWDNLPTVLEQMHVAKRKFAPFQWEKMIRRASMAGMQTVIIECVRRPRTALPLQDLRVLREIMWGIRRDAAESQWEAIATKRALAHAEKLLLLLEDRGGTHEHHVQPDDPRIQPDIIGIVTELAATRALRHTDREDRDGKAARYAERLSAILDRNLSLPPIDEKGWEKADYELLRWVPLRRAIALASQVLTEALPQPDKMRGLLEQLDDRIASAEGILIRASRREKTRGLMCLAQFRSEENDNHAEISENRVSD